MPVRITSLASAFCLLIPALAVSDARASTDGANELAPLADVVEPVTTRGLGSLAGYYLAARHASISKDVEAAAGFYGSALLKDPANPELLDRSVVMNVASGDIRRAAALSDQLLLTDPDDQVALLSTAVVDIFDKDVEAALATIEQLKGSGGQLQELMATLMRAWVLAQEGKPARGVNLLDELEGPSWYEAFTTLHAGLIADSADLHEIAQARLSRSLERDPGAIRVVDAYARHLARSDEQDQALAVLDRYDERIGETTYTRHLRAAIEGGEEIAPQIEDPRAGVAEAFYGIGSAMGAEGSDTFAASLLQMALFLAPGSDYPALSLGRVFEAMGQHEAAIEIYRRVPTDAPLGRGADVQEALNLNILERDDEAIALLTDLVEADPTDIPTAIALGNIYRSRERFEEAEQVYSAAIDILGEVPETYWTLHYYRGIARERTKDWPGAEKDFRKALELEEDQPLVLNYLGYSYIDRGENLDEALDMVRKAVEQRPEDGYIVDSLGWAYYRLGRYEDAVKELERAVSLRPNDPVINDHLGDAYWQVGRKLEAMFQWAHARDSDPEPEELPKILNKLKHGMTEAPDPVGETADAEAANPSEETPQ